MDDAAIATATAAVPDYDKECADQGQGWQKPTFGARGFLVFGFLRSKNP